MDNYKTILDYAAAQSPIQNYEEIEFAVVPEAYRIESVEKFREFPNRQRGTIGTESLDSFAEAFNRWREPTAIILASPGASKLIGHFRHHDKPTEEEMDARWIDHKATLTLTDSEEWKAWQSIHEKPLTQKQFFQFLEDRIEDVINPEPAELLEIAETIRGTRRVNFQNAQRMSNGDVSIIWDEVTEAKAGEKGQGTVPSKITIRVPIYEQAPSLTFDIVASFRWRVENNGLQISISIRHLPTVKRMAMAALLDSLRAKVDTETSKTPIILGTWHDA